MDKNIETQVRDLVQTYGQDTVWQNALLLIQNFCKQVSDTGEEAGV